MSHDVIGVAADVMLGTRKCCGASGRKSGVLLRIFEKFERLNFLVRAVERNVFLAECGPQTGNFPVRYI